MYVITDNAVKYTLKFLFTVAVPNGISYSVEIGEKAIAVKIKEYTILLPIMREEYSALLSGIAKYQKIQSLTGEGTIPLFFAREKDIFYTIDGKTVAVCGDIVTPSFVMLSRCEELETYEADGLHDFPASQSIACKYGFIDYPIVDEYGLYLRSMLKRLMPGLKIIPNKPKLIPTHDIDDIERFKPPKRIFTSLATDLFRLKSLKITSQSARWAIRSLYLDDPYTHAIKYLCDFSKRLGFVSEFYFMGAAPYGFDRGYAYSKRAIDAIRYADEKGAVLGFHAGYYTTERPELFLQEKERVEAAIGRRAIHGRQHYLRFNIKSTYKMWENNGMKTDSTLGYNEREGYRCGTCHEFKPYDLQSDEPFKVLSERPLIIMDGTIASRRNLTIGQGYHNVKTLMDRCKKAEGNFVVLWHNTGLTRGMDEWFKDVYCKVLTEF